MYKRSLAIFCMYLFFHGDYENRCKSSSELSNVKDGSSSTRLSEIKLKFKLNPQTTTKKLKIEKKSRKNDRNPTSKKTETDAVANMNGGNDKNDSHVEVMELNDNLHEKDEGEKDESSKTASSFTLHSNDSNDMEVTQGIPLDLPIEMHIHKKWFRMDLLLIRVI